MKTKHTPGFWRIASNGYCIENDEGASICKMSIGERSEANAAYIVRACNNHEKLLIMCKELLNNLQGKTESDPGLLEDRLIEIIKFAEHGADEGGICG